MRPIAAGCGDRLKPLVIELFCGKFGWGKGFVAEGWRCIGFDIVHEEWHRPVPPGCELVLQDVMTLHGSQFRDADLIIASPPCTEYSLWGMRMFHPDPPIPDKQLWEAALRIAREAGKPLIIENVRGAQYWWGRASWKCGPYYLWGDIPALFPYVKSKRKNVVDNVKNGDRRGLKVMAEFSSTSKQRRALTAAAAEIPFELASHIARVYYPR